MATLKTNCSRIDIEGERRRLEQAAKDLNDNPIFKEVGIRISQRLAGLPLASVRTGASQQQRDENAGEFAGLQWVASLPRVIEAEHLSLLARAEAEKLANDKSERSEDETDGLRGDSAKRQPSQKHSAGGTGRSRAGGILKK